MITRLKGSSKKEFIRFLLRSNCYQEYIFAISESPWKCSINSAERYIQSAFDWVRYGYLLQKGISWGSLHADWVLMLTLKRLKKKMH